MITRSFSPLLLLACSTFALAACAGDDGNDDGIGGGDQPFIGEWETIVEGPAASLDLLSVGDRLTSSKNFGNRGDIEVVYGAGDTIKVEMQRFTISSSLSVADDAFGRMSGWAYNLASPEPPSPDMAEDLCFAPDQDGCYVRNYYDGQLQPVRDGVNFRVTIPAGWPGDLLLSTEDNIASGIETYPDRGDISVMGLNGNLSIDLDSGNVDIKVDPNIAHFAGCAGSADCEAAGFDPDMCSCNTPTNITVVNKVGQASNMTVDLGTADNWYTVLIENRGDFSASSDFICTATLDCDAFDSCELDSDFEDLAFHERAEVNYPGEPAIRSSGIRISLTSEDCDNILYVDGPDDFDAETLPEEKRGTLNVCVGCL